MINMEPKRHLRMYGHRMSILPVAQYCGQAPVLSAQHGAGRPAAMSNAFHAKQAGAPHASRLMALLSDEEREEVESWSTPADVVIPVDAYSSITLDYASAEKELELGLDRWGNYVDPESGANCLTVGHMDFGWVRETGVRVAYVGDIKKTIWTTSEGPESLQLHAYGWAYARKHDCHAYATGLWCATEGEWLWSKEIVVLDSPRGEDIWARIEAAATNKGEYSRGQHCRGCWERLHCPEHVLAAAAAETFLAPVAAGIEPTPEQALDCLLKIQALEEVADAAKKQLKELVRRGALVIQDPATGKVWRPIIQPGRPSVDINKVRAVAPEAIRKGVPFDQMRWVNP